MTITAADVCVLIPTCHRPEGLERALRTLTITAPDVVAVVAHEADDLTAPHIAARFGAVATICSEPFAGGAKAWNDALRMAEKIRPFPAYFTGADDIAFVDGWLTQLLADVKRLGNSGLFGVNDNRKDPNQLGCCTHYLMTRDFIVEQHGGVAAVPHYRADFTDMEACDRAKLVNRYYYCPNAHIVHDWRGPNGDACYKRSTEARAGARPIYNERKKRLFPDDFPRVIPAAE